MAYMVQESWGCINGQDGFDELEVLGIDGDLLMSLLDEVHMDEYDCDDERLTSVIRSLEAEIDLIMTDSSEEIVWDESWNSCQYSNEFHVDDQDCSSSSSDDLDFNWMEMDDVSTFYMEQWGEGIEIVGGVRDCSQNSLEEHAHASL